MDVSKLAKKRAKRDLIIVPPKHEDDSNEDMRKREKALAIYGRHYEAPLMTDPPEEKPVRKLENAGDELDANKAKKLVLKKVRMALMSDDGGTEDLELQR